MLSFISQKQYQTKRQHCYDFFIKQVIISFSSYTILISKLNNKISFYYESLYICVSQLLRGANLRLSWSQVCRHTHILTQHSQQRQEHSVWSTSALSTKQVSGHTGLHSKTLFQKQDKERNQLTSDRFLFIRENARVTYIIK